MQGFSVFTVKIFAQGTSFFEQGFQSTKQQMKVVIRIKPIEGVCCFHSRRGKYFFVVTGNQPMKGAALSICQLQDIINLGKEQVPATKGQHGRNKGGHLYVLWHCVSLQHSTGILLHKGSTFIGIRQVPQLAHQFLIQLTLSPKRQYREESFLPGTPRKLHHQWKRGSSWMPN